MATLLAAVGLAACGTGIANANDLFNPNLDLVTAVDAPNSPPVGWNVLGILSASFPTGGFGDGEASEPWCNVSPPSAPNGYGIFFKGFSGHTNSDPNLNDVCSVYLYQDNPCSAGTKETLSGYVACESSFSAIQPPPPILPAPDVILYVEFLDNSGTVLASNAFSCIPGMGKTGFSSIVNLTTPQYTAPAGTVTVRAGGAMLYAYSTSGAQGLFMDSFDLESVPAPGSPAITTQPIAATVKPGGTATFTVGTTPVADTYSWLFQGTVLTDSPGHISGSTTATLTISGASTNDIGVYQAVVSNSSGLNRSMKVPLALNGLNVFPVVNLSGVIGSTYEIDRAPTVTGPWTSFSTNKLTMQPQYIIDTTLPVSQSEFYREVWLY